MSDQINDSIQTVLAESQQEKQMTSESDDVLGATLISGLLLLVVYMIKYAIQDYSWRSFWEAMKELPIDINSIIISVLFAYYYKISTINNLGILVIGLFGSAVICCVIRRGIKNIELRDLNFLNISFIGILTLVEYALPVAAIYYISTINFF